MDFMKVIDQTVREIKREVNLKVLKVPEIEQKVLDATDDEPWGPHGTTLAEIAQATKKFTECQMVMNVLWTRLTETGKNWRFVYKALTVIEYLVGHGSERAVDDIIEHTFQISSLASFEYVEPSGKDMGINVRKKAENIVALLNDKDKIQEVRNKASANRDKYFGLSSSGVTYKSGTASFSSSGLRSSDRYGGFGSSSDGDYRDSYKDKDSYDGDKFTPKTSVKKSHREVSSDSGNTSKKGSSRYGSKDQDGVVAGASKRTTSQSSSSLSNNYEDNDDDFDPRGTSSAKPSAGTTNQVNLFEQSLIGDLLDVPAPVSTVKSPMKSDPSEVDLFADANFVSATSQPEKGGSSGVQNKVDLFASQPAPSAVSSATNVDLFASRTTPSSTVSSAFDFFAAPDPVIQPDNKSSNSEQKTSSTVDPFAAVTQPDNKSSDTEQKTSSTVDPFAAVPLNNFDGSDPFGAFTSHTETTSTGSAQNAPNVRTGGNSNRSSVEIKSPPKKDNFQVKSGIWADSLSRGLIDLNITAPKKVNLADVGIVGGLTDGSDEKDSGPVTSFYMGRAMGAGSSLGKPGFASTAGGDDFFSSLSSQQYQFGNFRK